jgi:multidrug efflux pump subunit AcrA (membrane-fusion protein)
MFAFNITTTRAAVLAAALSMPALGAPAMAAEYTTVKATVQSTGNFATVAGSVVPYSEVILSAQVPGQVNFVAGREGDAFTAGQTLVTINDDELQARRRAALANMTSADAALRDAHVQYSRELYSPKTGQTTGMGMPAMMDNFFKPFTGQYAGPQNPWVDRYANLYGQVRGLDDARSRLLAAQSQIEQIDASIRDAKQVAPFDGVITEKLVEQGTPVQPGQPLVKFAHVAFVRIQAEVPVRLMSSLQRGQMLPARLDVGEGIELEARVAQIFPIADRSRHTVTVKFDLPKGVPGGPGVYAEVQIPDAGAQAQQLPTVPVQAVFQRGSLPAVMVLENGQPSLRLVRVGGAVGGGKVSILAGLAGGEDVIVAPPGQMSTMKGAPGKGG